MTQTQALLWLALARKRQHHQHLLRIYEIRKAISLTEVF
jgi:hypothetical protein